MPYRWVEADPILTHKDVTVYYIFKNDDEEQGTRTYWYTVNPDAGDESSDQRGVFDVRDLSTWGNEPEFPRSNGRDFNDRTFQQELNQYHAEQQRMIRRAIIEAIDKGEIKPWDDDAEPLEPLKKE
jgi:hypothetical protein